MGFDVENAGRDGRIVLRTELHVYLVYSDYSFCVRVVSKM